jgi:hypothetical protein
MSIFNRLLTRVLPVVLVTIALILGTFSVVHGRSASPSPAVVTAALEGELSDSFEQPVAFGSAVSSRIAASRGRSRKPKVRARQSAPIKELNYQAIADDIVQLFTWMTDPKIQPVRFIKLLDGSDCGNNPGNYNYCDITIRDLGQSLTGVEFGGLATQKYIESMNMTTTPEQDSVFGVIIRFKGKYNKIFSVSKLHSLLSVGELEQNPGLRYGRCRTSPCGGWRDYLLDIKNKKFMNSPRDYRLTIRVDVREKIDSNNRFVGYEPERLREIKLYSWPKPTRASN